MNYSLFIRSKLAFPETAENIKKDIAEFLEKQIVIVATSREKDMEIILVKTSMESKMY